MLLATYRAFLHLRLLKYVDDIFLHLPEHILADKINPLDLRSMVVTGFRGTLVGQFVVEAAVEMGGPEFGRQIGFKMAKLQTEHEIVLFTPMNHILETTILDAEFHKKLTSLLSEDDVASVDEGANERESCMSLILSGWKSDGTPNRPFRLAWVLL